jgi:hypothetical protein
MCAFPEPGELHETIQMNDILIFKRAHVSVGPVGVLFNAANVNP